MEDGTKGGDGRTVKHRERVDEHEQVGALDADNRQISMKGRTSTSALKPPPPRDDWSRTGRWIFQS